MDPLFSRNGGNDLLLSICNERRFSDQNGGGFVSFDGSGRWSEKGVCLVLLCVERRWMEFDDNGCLMGWNGNEWGLIEAIDEW